jgi:hypothetical protein
MPWWSKKRSMLSGSRTSARSFIRPALVEAELNCAVGDAKLLGEQVEITIALVKLTTEVFVGDTAQKAEGWIFP